MKRIIRLTESDLARIVRRVINEQPDGMMGGTGGPLTGTLMVRNPDAFVKYGDYLEFTWSAIKNAGKGPITIKRIIPMNSNMLIDKKGPFTVGPGETFELKAKQKLEKNATSLQNIDENGKVEFEGRILIETDGRKKNYYIYCRQNLTINPRY